MEELKESTVEEQTSKNEEITESVKKIKKPLWRRLLGGILTVVLIVIGAIAVYKGSSYILYKQDPVGNNHAATKAKKYEFVYSMVSDISGIFGIAGDAGKTFVAEHIVPLVNSWKVNDKEEALTNEGLQAFVDAGYTLEDEDEVAAYIGRKVKITGNISYVNRTYRSAAIVLDATYNTYESGMFSDTEEDSLTISLDYRLCPDSDGIFKNACVEIEGMLLVNPWDFSDEEWVYRSQVIVQSVKEADFVGLGGDPAEAYVHQKAVMPGELKVEGKNGEIEITGIIIDEETDNAAIRYTLQTEALESDEEWEANVYVAKGERLCFDNKWVIQDELREAEILLNPEVSEASKEYYLRETGASLRDAIGANEDGIRLIVCGYIVTEEMRGEKTIIEEERDEEGNIIYQSVEYENYMPYPVSVNPDADMYIEIDIPKEYWTIYSE